MSNKKYIPTKQDLAIAWKWKKHGFSVQKICQKLGISLKQYSMNRGMFNGYYLQSRQLETHSSHKTKLLALRTIEDLPVVKGKYYRDGQTKLSEPDINLELLRSYVLCGYTREKISNLLGITRATLYHYCQRFPSVKHVLDNARDEATASVVSNLLQMTRDRQVDDIAIASYLGEIYTKKVKKTVLGNPNMIKFWLANNLGWSSEPRQEGQDNKGAILKALDRLNGVEVPDEAPEDDNNFTFNDKDEVEDDN